MRTKLFQTLKQAAKALCLSLLAAVLLNIVAVPGAIALDSDSAELAMSRAASEVDRVVGEGTSNQIEGKAQRDIGKVKQSVGKVTGQVEGAADQVKGKVKSDIGRTQQAADNAGDTAEDTMEDLVDSVKDFFN